MKIYTKTGDKGDTRLFDGTQVRKNDPRVDAYGNVDELNSFIGAAGSFLQDNELKANTGRHPAGPVLTWARSWPIRSSTERSRSRSWMLPAVTALEETIDRFETELSPLRQFILAGGVPAGAMLHVARTVCRRAERAVVALAESVEIDPLTIEYLNRLSDFLFVMARLVNQRQGQQEIPW